MPTQEIIPLVDLKAQYREIKDEVDAAMLQCAAHASFIKGPDHAAFAEEFAAFCGGGHAALCGNGTDALYLALHELLGEGDGSGEIITTSHTFVATTEAIVRAGYKPVFVDIDPATYLIDAGQVEQAICERTKAILPVQLYGQMADMEAIMDIAHRHGLPVVEDAAQAHGAEFKGKGPGHWGAAACFSFFPGKNLGAFGDGGCVFSPDQGLVDRVRGFSDHGRARKYVHDRYGVNSRMDGIQAAVLRVKLRRLAGWNEQRQAIAARYNELLADSPVVRPHVADNCKHVFHLYVVRLADEKTRDRALQGLKDAGVMAGIHYPVPVHEQPAFAYLGIAPEDLPNTHYVASRILSLPIYPGMTAVQTERVAQTLLQVLS